VIARLRHRGGRAGALLLLPLSVIPMLLVTPGLVSSHARFERKFHSPPFAALEVRFSETARARYAPVPPFKGAVPVLVYHGINEQNDGYSVSREEFARQLEMLDMAGYRTITIAQYLRFRAGDIAGLPPRPILITFDDGRLDSFRGADRLLARHSMGAVMYVITGPVADGNGFHLSWEELHGMHDSGRWDIQPHARDGHRKIVVDGANRSGPFYASRRFTRSEGYESFADYTRRVGSDIYALKEDFRRQGFPSETFAAPFGDVGQNSREDRAEPFLRSLLATQFRVVFVQGAGNDPGYTTATGSTERFELHTATTADQLHRWLLRHHPVAGATGVER